MDKHHLRTMLTVRFLRRVGRSDLIGAVRKHGGFYAVAQHGYERRWRWMASRPASGSAWELQAAGEASGIVEQLCRS